MSDDKEFVTVSLQMIVKDEVEAIDKLVEQAQWSFDNINITCTHKNSLSKFKKLEKKYKNLHIDYFKWVDDFAAARNHNLKSAKDTYFMWLDADDSFDFSEVSNLVGMAEYGEYEAIYLPYNYAQDEDGNCVALHWRERIIRTDAGFTWRGVVHESLLKEDRFRGKRLDSPAVVHHNDDQEASMGRNHEILERHALVEKPDPRLVYYLGISYFSLGEYQEAITTLERYIKMSGWDEEMYRAFIKIGECYFMMDKPYDAIEQTLKAIAILPNYPDGYLAVARYEYAQENWKETLEWIEMAFSKPKVKSMSITNPQMWEYAKLYAAISQHELGNHRTAYKYLMKVPEKLRDELESGFKQEANLETFIEILPNIIGYLGALNVWDALPDELKLDNRLRWFRSEMVKPEEWPDKSIVFFCGAGYEEWGAHTLDKGMGGSEEAIVYLSRELVKLGYMVTVYGEVPELKEDTFSWGHDNKGTSYNGHVTYRPWREFDQRDKFDTVVVWRQPAYAKSIKNANKIIVDLHDVLNPNMVLEDDNLTYFVKSDYHRSLFPLAPDSNFKVIGNGIKKSQFDIKGVAKQPFTVGYFSAYYRGLEKLLDMWPEIRKEVPHATLDIYYGWQSWLAYEGEDALYKRITAQLEALKDEGVTEHGRVDHEKLAKQMKRIQVWAYPTEFPEIHCITALKTQEAGMYPVTTSVAALDETVQSGVKLDTKSIYSDEYVQKKFINEVVSALKEAKEGTPVEGVDWADVAKQWEDHINE